MYKFEWWRDGEKLGGYHCADPVQEDNWIVRDSMESGLRMGMTLFRDAIKDSVSVTIWFEV